MPGSDGAGGLEKLQAGLLQTEKLHQGFWRGVSVQAVKRGLQMTIHGATMNAESDGNVVALFTIGHELQNFQLAGREFVRGGFHLEKISLFTNGTSAMPM